MEDKNGLELSLGLSCGGSSSKSKVDIPSDLKVEAGSSRSDTSDPSFKNFFQISNERQDSKGKQSSDPILPQNENFFTDLTKSAAPVRDVSHGVHNMRTSKSKTADSEENSNKRKMPFEEVIFKNKQEKVVDYTNAPVKNTTSINIFRNSQVSNPVKNVSANENEDISESETEGSNSWFVSQHEDKFKYSNISKFTDKYVLSNSSGNCSKSQKESSMSRVEANHENGAYGIPSALPFPMHARLGTAPSASNPTRFPSPCVMQMKPIAINEHSSGQALDTSNLQLAFGFQLPTLETGSSWAFQSKPRLDKDNADGVSSSERSAVKMSHGSAHASLVSSPAPAVAYEGTPSDLAKANGKHAGEVTASSKIQDVGKDKFSMFTRQSLVDPFPQLGLGIKQGLAPEIKFGGGGSCPNLPWVSTTGSGPNGKTISGAMYKYSQSQVKIVCACHGTHMSPEEFVQHASADSSRPEDNTAFLNNSAASAKS